MVFSLVRTDIRDESQIIPISVPQLTKKRPLGPFLVKGSERSNNRLRSRNTNILTPRTQERPVVVSGTRQ